MIMTFINTRESTNQSTKVEVEGDDCGEVVTRRRTPENDGEQAADNIRMLLQEVAGTSVQEMDKVIAEMMSLRVLRGRFRFFDQTGGRSSMPRRKLMHAGASRASRERHRRRCCPASEHGGLSPGPLTQAAPLTPLSILVENFFTTTGCS
jgi:hypothetical protein